LIYILGCSPFLGSWRPGCPMWGDSL